MHKQGYRVGDVDPRSLVRVPWQLPSTWRDAGFVDTYLVAGRPECNPETGEGCSCCVEGGLPLAGLDDPAGQFTERIDFILARPSPDCSLIVDPERTAHWADRPLDRPVECLWWATDHAGVMAGLSVTC